MLQVVVDNHPQRGRCLRHADERLAGNILDCDGLNGCQAMIARQHNGKRLRPQEGQMSHMPAGMAFMFLAILALAGIYAMLYQSGATLADGARTGAIFGGLIGVFAIGAFVMHNYVNLNIGLKGTVQQAVAYFVEWVIVGLVIGLIYRPAAR